MPPVSTAALVVAAFLAGLLAPRFLHGAAEPHEDHVRVSALQAANTMLQQKLRVAGDTLEQLQKNHGATIEELSTKMAEMEGNDGPAEKGGDGLGGGGQGGCKRCRKQLEACRRSSAAVPAADAPPAATAGGSPVAATANGGHAENDTLLSAHRHWDWKAIVQDMMQPWPRIEVDQLETAVAACNDNGTMYCSRMQIIDGSLYLTDYRAIFFDRHYAPARVMPLLETLRRHPELPNMDLVVAGNDEPRVPAIPGERWSWGRTCKRWPGGSDRKKAPPAIFASTTNRGVMDLPWVGTPMWGWIPD